MKTVRFLVWTLLLTFSVGASAVFAQATATSELRGQVTDPNGAAVAGAKGESGGGSRTSAFCLSPFRVQ